MPLIALSTGSLYSYGLQRAFDLAKGAGFDGAEVLVDQRPDTFQPDYLNRLQRQSGLPILALHSPFLPAASWGLGDWPRVQRTLALAREVGANVVIAHLPRRMSGIQIQWLWRRGHRWVLPVPWGGDREWLDALRQGLGHLQTDAGAVVAIENMPAGRFGPFRLNRYWLNTPRGLATLPRIALDTTHLGTWGADLLATYEHLKDRLAHVHLSNFDGREHRLPTNGRLPLAEFLVRLGADRYPGIVTLETDPQALDAEDEARVRANLEHSLGFCRQYLAMGIERQA